MLVGSTRLRQAGQLIIQMQKRQIQLQSMELTEIISAMVGPQDQTDVLIQVSQPIRIHSILIKSRVQAIHPSVRPSVASCSRGPGGNEL